MQRCVSFGLAVVVALALSHVNCAAAASSRSGAASRLAARMWLKAHPGQQPDELAELKDQNPMAYAIVKALLTKRSLGLLDPKHPTASFAKSPQQDDEAAAKGPEVFRNMMTPAELAGHASGGETDQEEEQVAMVPAAPKNHNWLSWKPTNSAVDDEAAVKSVLGAVSELRGGGRPKTADEGSPASSLTADEALVSDSPHDAEESAPTAPVATHPVAPTSRTNSYSQDINLAGVFERDENAAKPQNLYVNSPGDMGESGRRVSLGGDLASSKFGSEADGTDVVVSGQPTPKTSAGGAKQSSTLLSWLGVVDKPSAKAAEKQQAAEQPEENPYMGLLK